MGTQLWTLWSAFFVLCFCRAELTVFLSAQEANKIIARSKRANFMILEEILQGNLERECLEERCSYEEAREVFEDIEKTDKFWNNYFGGRQCSSNPCLHNAVCKDNIRSYTCACTDGYEGSNCAFVKNECRHEMNEGCHHFCYPEPKSYRCSCAQGYKLVQGKSCVPLDDCSCGRFNENVQMKHAAAGNISRGFPWQVLFLNSEGEGLCGGVLLKANFVLTTADCALLSPVSAVIGNDRLIEARQLTYVKQVNIHLRYDNSTSKNNLALIQLATPSACNSSHLPICLPEKDFAEHVLILEQVATLSGWKMERDQLTDSLAEFQILYLQENECTQTVNRTLTTREFCGYHHEAISQQPARGSFSAVNYKGTWFLTGILEPQATEASKWNLFVFTKISRYMMWFKQIME
ncbi:vitamin K-dependent protein Z isoform X2 [Sphaerodactylus townsendi]|uniref:vitamin K-dependent protein Z isoform X2 n=1 Tax=Sphaerodactylus townsendi TaxID=933632 RepID=UPI00202672FA|nr:vitamin K-dependent protein Z isoform X2 [Sphaerodactylus townsendi]